jgi:hypothetical protein
MGCADVGYVGQPGYYNNGYNNGYSNGYHGGYNGVVVRRDVIY